MNSKLDCYVLYTKMSAEDWYLLQLSCFQDFRLSESKGFKSRFQSLHLLMHFLPHTDLLSLAIAQLLEFGLTLLDLLSKLLELVSLQTAAKLGL